MKTKKTKTLRLSSDEQAAAEAAKLGIAVDVLKSQTLDLIRALVEKGYEVKLTV